MRKINITLILNLFSVFLFGQNTFQKSYGDSLINGGEEIQVTSDGGFIIVGTTWINGTNSAAFLLKTDSIGNVQWMKNYAGTYTNWGYSVQQTADEGYVFCGAYQYSIDSAVVYLVKTDSNGDTLWTKTYQNEWENYAGFFVRQTSDHGFVIAGGGIFKTDSIGNFLWANYLGGLVQEVHEAADGGIIALAFDFIKTSSNGIFQWARKPALSALYNFVFHNIAVTYDGGFILAGYYDNYAGLTGSYLVKTDSSGDTLWTRSYYLNPSSLALNTRSVQQTSDGGYIVVGNLFAANQPYYTFALKIDASGNVSWMKRYSVPGGNNSGRCVRQTPDGGFIILSYLSGVGAGATDIYLIKTDSAGNSSCNDSILNPSILVPSDAFTISNFSGWDTLYTFSYLTSVNSDNPLLTDICNLPVGTDVFSKNDGKIIRIFPNPFTKEIIITPQKQKVKQSTILVKNILGQILFSRQETNLSPDNPKSINLCFLSKGIYLLDVIVDGERIVKKIVKE